jgi:hypothetical protein
MNHNRVTYKVIPEHRVVIAEIDSTDFDALREFNDKYLAHSTSALRLRVDKYDEKFLMPHSFKAVARCHPEDEFDIEKGKRIALDRLADKYTNSLNRHLNNYIRAIDEALTFLAIALPDED